MVLSCLCSLSLSLSTLWFVVVLALVIFLRIPYQDLADKEEKTQNEEAAPEDRINKEPTR
jgi:preprotein translocase subunit SecG